MKSSTNHKKWINLFRNNLKQSEIDPSVYTDKEILIIAKGCMAPILCEQQGIEHEWVFELFWNALLFMDPDDQEINLDMFKKRAKENKN